MRTSFTILRSVSERSMSRKWASASLIDMDITSTIVFPATVAARDSAFRRVPWQVGHWRSLWYASSFSRCSSLSASSSRRWSVASTPSNGLSTLRQGRMRSSENPCIRLCLNFGVSFS